MHLLLLSYRSAGGESDNPGVLPRRSVVRRNSRSSLPLANGGQRDGVYYSHHQTPKRYNLDQIPHGPAWIPDLLSHLHAHLATSNSPSIHQRTSAAVFFMSMSVYWQVFHWCLCNRIFKGGLFISLFCITDQNESCVSWQTCWILLYNICKADLLNILNLALLYPCRLACLCWWFTALLCPVSPHQRNSVKPATGMCMILTKCVFLVIINTTGYL